jgi:hypothetical protein
MFNFLKKEEDQLIVLEEKNTLEEEYQKTIAEMALREKTLQEKIEKFIENLSIEAKILKTILEVSDEEYHNKMNDMDDNFAFIIGRYLWDGTLKNEDKIQEFYQKSYKEARASIAKYTENW